MPTDLPTPPRDPAEEQQLLQRIVSRLCVAFDGHDQFLDETLRGLRQAMRRPNTVAELERSFAELTAAIKRADDARETGGKPARPPEERRRPAVADETPAPIASPMPAPEPAVFAAAAASAARKTLAELADQLELSPVLQQGLADLKQRIAACELPGDLSQAGRSLAVLVNQQRVDLQRERDRVTVVLQQVSGSLDEMARHLRNETEFHSTTASERLQLNTAVMSEVGAMDANVGNARDLVHLQQQVRSHLELIGGHLQRYNHRELTRLSDYSMVTDRMKNRVEQLERETRNLQESVQREQHRAYTDALSGIPNRLAFEQRIAEEYQHWSRSGVPLCIAVWDIDHFKAVNDTYGHRAGDNAIRIVGQHLARALRKSDFVARYGGEEFVVILRGIGPADALRHADRVRQSLEQLGVHFDQSRITITASCGITAFAGEDSIEAAIGRADAALYQAKRNGRNQCTVA